MASTKNYKTDKNFLFETTLLLIKSAHEQTNEIMAYFHYFGTIKVDRKRYR